MNVIWQDITWDVARAGGFTSYILLTLAVFVGLALSTQVQSRTHWPRLINSELHNFLTLLSTTFLGIHIAAVWVDPFTHFGWREILLPFAGHYRPLWMALGIIGLYLGLAIGLSTLLRPRIGYTWWKRLHVLTLAIFVLAGAHGIMTGSDTHATWAMGIYVASFLLVAPLLSRRIFARKQKSKRALKHGAATTPNAPAMSQQRERSLPTRGVAIHQP